MSDPAPMPSQKMKRSLNPFKFIFTVLAILLMLIVLGAVRFTNFLRRKASIGDVKFPVLILQPNGMAPFAEWDSTGLYKFHEKSTRFPVEDTIVIDSDFNLYQQKNVKYASGDLNWIARTLISPSIRVKYTFDLFRVKRENRDEAIKRLLAHPKLTNIEELNEADLRLAIPNQPTFADVLSVLRIEKPPEPPPSTVPATIETMPTKQDVEGAEPQP